jgi:hypothetical protein
MSVLKQTTGRMISSGTNSPPAGGIDPVIVTLTTGRMLPSGINNLLAEVSTQ